VILGLTTARAQRVPHAFDPVGATNPVGTPFLRVFCEGAGVRNAGTIDRSPNPFRIFTYFSAAFGKGTTSVAAEHL
jgi:hypothetical protein